jgi:hypothetical protein
MSNATPFDVNLLSEPFDWSRRMSGIRFARAGGHEWRREALETELDFLDRCRSEAREAGHCAITIRGWLRV